MRGVGGAGVEPEPGLKLPAERQRVRPDQYGPLAVGVEHGETLWRFVFAFRYSNIGFLAKSEAIFLLVEQAPRQIEAIRGDSAQHRLPAEDHLSKYRICI